MPLRRGKARISGSFPEQTNGNGVMVMEQSTGVRACLYGHTSRLGLASTRRRSVRRQGAILTFGGDALAATS